MRGLILLGLVFAMPCGFAQQTEVVSAVRLEAGTTLPVVLLGAIHAGKTAVGTRVVAVTTQRVPVGAHLFLKRGAEATGEVTESSGGGAGREAVLGVRFTALRYRGWIVPIAANAVAIANFTDADDTYQPTTGGPDRGNASPASWTTEQIGGDEVYRSGWKGPVCNAETKVVGFADFDGVYESAGATAGGPEFPLAMGVFSTTAAGLYGFDDGVELHSAGGAIRITGPAKKVLVRRGDNLLLRVVAGR